jgi:hypothetical protein
MSALSNRPAVLPGALTAGVFSLSQSSSRLPLLA